VDGHGQRRILGRKQFVISRSKIRAAKAQRCPEEALGVSALRAGELGMDRHRIDLMAPPRAWRRADYPSFAYADLGHRQLIFSDRGRDTRHVENVSNSGRAQCLPYRAEVHNSRFEARDMRTNQNEPKSERTEIQAGA
jgi:hypothetical protein